MSDDELRKFGIMQESMQDDIKKILEIVSSQQTNISKIPVIETKVDSLSDDMKAVKKVLKITNEDARLLERRVTKLENA